MEKVEVVLQEDALVVDTRVRLGSIAVIVDTTIIRKEKSIFNIVTL